MTDPDTPDTVPTVRRAVADDAAVLADLLYRFNTEFDTATDPASLTAPHPLPVAPRLFRHGTK